MIDGGHRARLYKRTKKVSTGRKKERNECVRTLPGYKILVRESPLSRNGPVSFQGENEAVRR
jgi:hypothetical protein